MLATLSGLTSLSVTRGEPWWHDDAALPLEEGAVTEQVARAAKPHDCDRNMATELGYRVAAYSGPAPRDNRGVGVMVHAGSTADRGGNSVIVEPCRLEDGAVFAAQAGGVVRLLAGAWAPTGSSSPEATCTMPSSSLARTLGRSPGSPTGTAPVWPSPEPRYVRTCNISPAAP